MPDREALTQQILSMTPDELDLFICLVKREFGPQILGTPAPDRPSIG